MAWVLDALQVVVVLFLVLMLVAFPLLVRWTRSEEPEQRPKEGAPRGKGTP